LKRYHHAIIDFENALDLDPAFAEAAYLLGNTYYNAGYFEKALDKYSQAFFYDDQNLSALYWRLMTRLQIKDENGFILNHEAAQYDAGLMLPYADKFFKLSDKEGRPLELVKIDISEMGDLNFRVNQNPEI
jgi:tetratricopeptide (TPR) repeat protein